MTGDRLTPRESRSRGGGRVPRSPSYPAQPTNRAIAAYWQAAARQT